MPFVDVVNTMLDETLPLTVGEFEEWGNPKKKDEYVYMRSYSPYDNLRKGAYPSILVKTSFNDSQVMYWEPAKYVAKLRTLKTDRNPLLLKTNMAGGHGGSSGRYDRLRETAFDQAFVLTQLGVPELPVPARPVHTFSIVARDPATGSSASRSSRTGSPSGRSSRGRKPGSARSPRSRSSTRATARSASRS